MTMPDRRQAQRTKSDEIIYVDMGPDNGGIVLDISDGGLAFCTAIPIQQADEVEFSLVVKGKGRIEGAGSVAWRNKAGRKCGVKLASNSADAAERLQQLAYPTHTAIQNISSNQTLLANEETQPNALPVCENDSPLLQPVQPPGPAPLPERSKSKSERGPFDVMTAEDLASMTPEKVIPGAAVRALAATFLITIFAVGAYSYRSGGKEGWAAFSGNSSASADPQPNSTTLAAEKHLPTADIGATGSTNGDASGASHDGGESELANALQLLQAASGQRDTSSAIKLLRVAVSSGNSTAETVLAEMYLEGDGVPRSCSQARALLTAASRIGSVEAKAKLQELNIAGCR
jgi:hypothetical protein